jgi:hypothetical protein
MLAALSFNIIGDGLRDLLDPTLKASSGSDGRFARVLAFRRRRVAPPDISQQGAPAAPASKYPVQQS